MVVPPRRRGLHIAAITIVGCRRCITAGNICLFVVAIITYIHLLLLLVSSGLYHIIVAGRWRLLWLIGARSLLVLALMLVALMLVVVVMLVVAVAAMVAVVARPLAVRFAACSGAGGRQVVVFARPLVLVFAVEVATGIFRFAQHWVVVGLVGVGAVHGQLAGGTIQMAVMVLVLALAYRWRVGYDFLYLKQILAQRNVHGGLVLLHHYGKWYRARANAYP